MTEEEPKLKDSKGKYIDIGIGIAAITFFILAGR